MGPMVSAYALPGTLRLPHAEVDFNGARPVSRRFGDIYYDVDGAAEAARVFLEPADVATRASQRGSTFTVAELGFGTGLNFLATAAATRSRLHYVSFECYPLAKPDLTRALAPWRGVFPLTRHLEAAYPPPVRGWHRRLFDSARVQLSVYLGDVGAGLADFARQQRRGVDAWFLDGFAPARNPSMWHPDLFRTLAELSAPDATVTTFTAAGEVRRHLTAAGFDVRRVDQRPRKRHSTAATFTGKGRTYRPPSAVAVIGAGLAGAATARALAEKGIPATLVDRGEGVAAGASAIPAAVLHGRLLPSRTTEAAHRALAYSFAAARCAGHPGVDATGALQLPGPRSDAARLRRIAATVPEEVAAYAESATVLAGVDIDGGGLFFPAALTIAGRIFAGHLAAHPGIERATERPAQDLTLVYATGADISGFDFLEVIPVAGQLDRFAAAKPPNLPLVGNGVFVPLPASVWVGATYEHRPWPAAQATAANAARFARILGRPPDARLAAFRASRAVTSDRRPVIGRDGDTWFNLGHGSHGTITAVLGAEIVASALNGEVAPATVDMLETFAPHRFRVRQQRRPNPFAHRHHERLES